MYDGESLLTCNGYIYLILQSDGNLVEYDSNHIALWASYTAGHGNPPYQLLMQADGNLVIYDASSSAIWSTSSFGSNAYLVLQTDANIVIYSDSGVLWASNTANTFGCRGVEHMGYVGVNLLLDWTSAQSYCLSNYGASLATISNSTQNNLVRDAASVAGIGNDEYLWIGLNDIDIEGTFVWEDNTSPLVYENWNSGEPNDYGDEDCVEMRSGNVWNDMACTTTRYFVCNIASSSSNTGMLRVSSMLF